MTLYRIYTVFSRVCDTEKLCNLFYVSKSFLCDFKTFWKPKISDIISAYIKFCNLKVLAKKKAKLNHRKNNGMYDITISLKLRMTQIY